MNIQLHRLNDDGKSTIGALYIDSKFQCFTLEDTYNEPKIYGKTRIPEGSYEVTLRHEGSMVEKYDDRYDGHDGMLWIRNVDSFEYVYIHVGNNANKTTFLKSVEIDSSKELLDTKEFIEVIDG